MFSEDNQLVGGKKGFEISLSTAGQDFDVLGTGTVLFCTFEIGREVGGRYGV